MDDEPADLSPDDPHSRGILERVRARARMTRTFGSPPLAEYVTSTACSVSVFRRHRGQAVISKYFTTDAAGRRAFEAERTSAEVFGDRPWRMPVLAWHRGRGFSVERLDPSARLDVASDGLDDTRRLDAAVWALDVLLEIYLAGYLHGDLQPHNIWLYHGRLVATDFETFGPRGAGVAFLDSGDITGHDPLPRERPLDPAFDPDDDWSFHRRLGVPLDRAVDTLRDRLRRRSATDPAAERRLAALDSTEDVRLPGR